MGPSWNFISQILRSSAAMKITSPMTSINCVRMYASTFLRTSSHQLSCQASLQTSQMWRKKRKDSQEYQILQPCPLSWSICRTYAKKGKDKGVFDSLVVKTPDGNFPLIQLGQVVQKSPQLLTINMASSPQYIPQVKQALADSGLNVNPQQDGTSLFIPLPKVTREHRENLAKNAKMLSEQSKKSLRDLYSKYSRKIKASKEGHSSDDLRAADDMVKDLMHSVVHQVEEMTAAKQKELLGGK
ncbi:mitochondrial ribosome recycling factor [Elysia marginata]|uniref:Ribosome-recycling factor, mitochondrial n=1 Tax=Elysia marginata TaxID=1093978 RepID=A0AAV4HDE4_9GAST|nr:mitochondrial ribosome recycling factor [Elysia marginata]